jgi:hypothetical protein
MEKESNDDIATNFALASNGSLSDLLGIPVSPPNAREAIRF